MSLVFAAVIPNNPLLATELLNPPESKNSATVDALKELEGELYFMKPDLIILLTSHGSVVPELINTNIGSTLHGTWPDNLSELRQMEQTFKGDVEFAAHLKEVIDTDEQGVPMTIMAESKLHPEITTPLTFLLAHLENTRVVVMCTAQLTILEHYLYGEFVEQQILQTNKRIAVFATGHLSNSAASASSTDSAEPTQKAYDKLVVDFLEKQKREDILRIDEEILANSQSDLVMPLATLLGIISKVNVNVEILSSERLHDEGQLVANFVLK